MGKLDDVADYLLDPGYTSASEVSGSEADTDAEVEVLESRARRVMSRGKRERMLAQQAAAVENGDGNAGDGAGSRSNRPAAQKRAVKLTEIGPRMTLRLVKVEEGLCEGKVMWHEFVTKTAAEQKEMEAMWEERRREKEERKRAQKENVERKRKEKKRGKRGADGEGGGEDGDEDEKDWDNYDEEMDYGDDFLREDDDDDDAGKGEAEEDVEMEMEEE